MNRVTRAISRAAAMGGDGSDDDDDDFDDGARRSRPPNKNKPAAGLPRDEPGPMDDPSSDLHQFLDATQPLGKSEAFFYSLELQPLKVRRERVIMVAEAYSIFGALFLNGVWFIWEYGNSSGFQNETLHYAFEVLCALSILTNVFLAMFGSFLWIMSALHSGANPHWSFGAVKWMGDFHIIQLLAFVSTFVTLGIAIYNRLQEHLVVAILIPVLMLAIVAKLMIQGTCVFADQIPLEMFHMPWHFTYLIGYPIAKRLVKQDHKAAVARRAEYLKQMAQSERAQQKGEQFDSSGSELHLLLSKAAQMLGRSDADVAPYVAELQEAWYDDVESLKGKSAEALSKYMPDRLAETVCTLLESDGFGVEWAQS